MQKHIFIAHFVSFLEYLVVRRGLMINGYNPNTPSSGHFVHICSSSI